MAGPYINLVVDRSKYAPIPPPLIVRPTEATETNPPIAWLPRSAVWSYSNYDGGLGPRKNSIDIDPSPSRIDRTIGSHAPWLLHDVITGDIAALQVWIVTYLLKSIDPELGVVYLDKIDFEGAAYPEEIQSAIRSVIDDPSTAGLVANQLGLYLPRSARESLDFFLLSLYWLRKFRPERISLEPLLEKITHTDLYLVTPNPYEHHPGRKLLSYYDDQELYSKFGQIGNQLFPKLYRSKREQLDGLVAFGMRQFGYIRVLSWSRPIRLMYHPAVGGRSELSLEELLRRREIPRMVLLRLGIEVHSSWPWLRDPEAWRPLISLIDNQANLFYNEYIAAKQRDYAFLPGLLQEESRPGRETVISLPETQAEPPKECLVCRLLRPDGDFSLCGHPICLTCQALIRSARCPFCTEHFTADHIEDDFVKLIQDGVPPRQPLQEQVLKVLEASRNRTFRFDWANLNIQLFGIKSL